MSRVEFVEHLKQLSNAERLEVIEAATRLVREQLASDDVNSRGRQDDCSASLAKSSPTR